MINVKVTAPTATITINRPEKHNALNADAIVQLRQAFADLHGQRNVKAVILTGAGETFCAGVDLNAWYRTMQTVEGGLDSWEEVAAELQSLIEMMMRFPKVIISAIDGGAIGFGFALLLASDLVVASERAYFHLPAPKFGLVSGHVAPLLYFRFGGSVAARVLLGNERIEGRVAHNLGWVHRLVPSDQIWVAANEWATDIASGAAESLQMTKRLLNEMIGESMFDALSSGASALATMCTSEVAVEGLAAFVEKRQPKF